MQIHLTDVEHAQLVASLEDRRDVLEKIRRRLVVASLNTQDVDHAIETLDSLKVALGIEPADLFDSKEGE